LQVIPFSGKSTPTDNLGKSEQVNPKKMLSVIIFLIYRVTMEAYKK
jgi:hypothetical protein